MQPQNDFGRSPLQSRKVPVGERILYICLGWAIVGSVFGMFIGTGWLLTLVFLGCNTITQIAPALTWLAACFTCIWTSSYSAQLLTRINAQKYQQSVRK